MEVVGDILGYLLAAVISLIILAAVIGWIVSTDWKAEFRTISYNVGNRWDDVGPLMVKCAVAVVICGIASQLFKPGPDDTQSLGTTSVLFIMAAVLAAYIFVRGLLHLVGGVFDRSSSPPGLEFVLSQNAHKTGGNANEAQVDAALRDQSEVISEPQFDE
jgi:hypothetical protein